jgi:hypothetical protein
MISLNRVLKNVVVLVAAVYHLFMLSIQVSYNEMQCNVVQYNTSHDSSILLCPPVHGCMAACRVLIGV